MDENKTSFSKAKILFLCAIGLVLINGYFTVRVDRNVVINTSRPPSEVQHKLSTDEKDRIIADVNNALAKAEEKNNVLLDIFHNKCETSIDQSFNEANKNIPFTVSKLSNYKFCLKLTYKITKDYVTGSSEAQNMVNPIVEDNIYFYCRQGESQTQELLAGLRHDMVDNTNNFRKELSLSIDNEITSWATNYDNEYQFEEFDIDAEKIIDEIRDNRISMAFPVVVESIVIKSTYTAMEKCFSGIATKLTKSAGTGGTIALADGPLPIGDVIGGSVAIAGVLCAGNDFITALRDLPELLRNSLENTIKDSRQRVFDNADMQAEALVINFDNKNTELANYLKKQVEEAD